MLSSYIRRLTNIYGWEENGDEKKNREIEGLAMEKVLEELEEFIKSSLSDEKKEKFVLRINKSLENNDDNAVLNTMIRALMRIPHFKYKLDARMKAMIASEKYRLVKNVREGIWKVV